MDAYKTKVFIWGLFLTSSMIAAIHLWPNYVSNSEIYKSTKFENIENVFNITQKLIQEHSEEILNAKCVEYSSLSWARSVLANDQAMKCAKAKACVYADSFLCIGRMEQAPGATVQRWKGQIEDLRKYSSHQDAVGLDGEAIEFEWIFSQDFWHWLFSRRSRWTWRSRTSNQENFKVRIVFMSMFNDILWKADDENCISKAEKVKKCAKKFLPGHWTFVCSGSERDGLATLTMDSGIAQPRKWYSNEKKLVILSSQAPVLWVVESWSREEAAVDRYSCRTPHFLMHSRCTDCSPVCTVISRTRVAQDWSTSFCPTCAMSHTLQHSCTGTPSPPFFCPAIWRTLPRSTAPSARHFCGTTTTYKYHSLQWRFCEHETLVSNSSLRESDRCLRGRHGLVLSIRFDEWRKILAIPVDNGIMMMGTRRSGNVGISSELGTWKQDARRRELPSIGKENTDDTMIWKKALFQHLVIAGNCYKTRPDDKDGW